MHCIVNPELSEITSKSFLFLGISLVFTFSFTVSVNNGYGSGKYKIGDTVHVFSIAYTDNQLFDAWSSADLSLLNAPLEWHTWLWR